MNEVQAITTAAEKLARAALTAEQEKEDLRLAVARYLDGKIDRETMAIHVGVWTSERFPDASRLAS